MARWLHDIVRDRQEKARDEELSERDNLQEQVECLRREVADLKDMLVRHLGRGHG